MQDTGSDSSCARETADCSYGCYARMRVILHRVPIAEEARQRAHPLARVALLADAAHHAADRLERRAHVGHRHGVARGDVVAGAVDVRLLVRKTGAAEVFR